MPLTSSGAVFVGKLVVLKLGDGSFEQGFPATLQIGDEKHHPSLEITGKLPPAPDIPQHYSKWANAYRGLGMRYRLEAKAGFVTNVSKVENCSTGAQALSVRLNAWLRTESFYPLREKLLEQLMPSDEVRIIIQTENILLRRLPWHLWDICDRYPKAEIALSAPIYERVEPTTQTKTKVKILAILGNSTGIDTQADRLLLEHLPDAQISFLVEPQRQELTEELWRQGWDILFFAGHSSSHHNGETGRIYINQTDSLTIDQLKYALKKAVERGLKIAIFNSCDGLGLARNLADLNIPQIIVMREPVPDRVSQEFLKYFLEAFASGESFYLAVREAREKLQGLEDQFPCATWLPMICQNPAIAPPTWHDLGGKHRSNTTEVPIFDSPIEIEPRKPQILRGKRGLLGVFCLSLVATFLLMAVRQLGMLQSLELQAFDHLMRTRKAEANDSRLLVVKITEADIQAQDKESRRGASLSDASLAKLLQLLESYQPRAIGLDVFRDFPVAAEYPELAKLLQTSDRLIAVCKVSNPNNDDPGVSSPPEVPKENLGFADVVPDPDSVIRRHLLAMTPPPVSPCTASYALSSQLAFRYLAAEGILPKFTSKGELQLGKTIFERLSANTGGYQNIDAAGYQIMLNYRSGRSPENFAPQVTLSEVLEGKLNPNAVKDRIVVVGVTAIRGKDYFFTPNSKSIKGDEFYHKMPGVVIHAQMVSQIISAVLDERPLLWVWPEWGEALWIWGWSMTGGIIFWRFQSWQRTGLVVVALGSLYGFCAGLITQGGWIPLVPAVLVLLFTGSSVVTYIAFQSQRQKSKFFF
ncbi:CHASE2 domain-containing protein [Lyngbya aestuarii]|uniref:CHASE2 domain-containing protein n=1 Tax=Lyngbya aestuarii TaxID=118322 RepID=UPI00403D7BF1